MSEFLRILCQGNVFPGFYFDWGQAYALACVREGKRLQFLSSVLNPSSIQLLYGMSRTNVMSKRLDLRLPDEDIETLELYCQTTGATKTGTIKMLLQILKDEHLLAIVRKSLTID